MKLTTEKINELLGVDDAYKAPEALMNILLNRDKREIVFNKFLEIENDLTFDWFHEYFQDEHAESQETRFYAKFYWRSDCKNRRTWKRIDT